MADDITQTPAYKRGVARAASERLKAPPDDGTVEVSVTGPGGKLEYFKLCRDCGQATTWCTC